jgi:flagellar biosynthesis protein FlhF
VGKTLSLVKIAARFGVTTRRPAQILSLDTERIAGIETARAYAAILGIGFQPLDSTHALSQALAEHANKDLILIDTPGMTASTALAEKETAAFFAARKEIDKHLVLPATASSPTLLGYVNGFHGFAPDKLLFTRLDEIDGRLGPLLETAIESGIPLSYCSTGPSAPDDLEEARPATYCERVLPTWLNEPAPARSKQAAA